MSTIPPGNENLSSGVALLLHHVRNQLSSPGTNSCLDDSKPFKMLWQVSATTALVCLLLVISQKPRSSGRLIHTKSKALELIMRWSRKELLEDEDQLRTGSLLYPGALRLCSEIIHGKEQVQLRSFAAGFLQHYIRMQEIHGTHPGGCHSPSSHPQNKA